MLTVETVRKDTIDLTPADFFEMMKENPSEIASFHVIPPTLGKSHDFGKVRVKLSTPRYEVEL
ncbi:MAG: hypothetical protein GX256_08240 [Fretibacterium sp.]|nr:hypothetical protein [Fretibacterium sp.]